jgi:threonine/homoserine/homoserine lactone efflux protein
VTPLAWVGVALVCGALLIWGASRATVSVNEGRVFVKWMVVVFGAFLVLAAIPILAGS